jgi:chemotaxis protein methyltransferase CheR
MTAVVARADLERFRSVVAARFGLQYEDAKLDYLADVLQQRLEATGAAGAGSYLETLASPLREDERQALVGHLTVSETFFFRNADNFRALAGHVLPERVRRRQTRTLRILSAGCASGEEPYSLAMMIREALPELDRWDVKIVGLDLNPAMISRAREARYSAWSLRATNEEMRQRYFRPQGRDFVLAPEIRSMVDFQEGNLVDEDALLWQPDRYDLIFCRNVIMYFTPEVMGAVVRRVAQALVPGGFFFLGHAETLRGLSQDFHLCHTHDTFYYQRRDGRASGGPPAPAEAAPANESLPAVVEAATSWVEAIQRASARIADLSLPAAPPSPPRSAPSDLGLVLEAMRQERFTEALSLLTALPAEPDTVLLRAVLLINSGSRSEAEAVCARLLALDELNAGAHYVMALCREHAGDAPGAIECDRTALYLDAGFAMPHLHLGLMAARRGDLPTARHEHSQALMLLAREDASRLLLFGGGFSRETLMRLCRTELANAENDR